MTHISRVVKIWCFENVLHFILQVAWLCIRILLLFQKSNGSMGNWQRTPSMYLGVVQNWQRTPSIYNRTDGVYLFFWYMFLFHINLKYILFVFRFFFCFFSIIRISFETMKIWVCIFANYYLFSFWLDGIISVLLGNCFLDRIWILLL